MADEPQLLGTHHLQSIVDRLARAASSMERAAGASQGSGSRGASSAYPTSSTPGWRGSVASFAAGWNGQIPTAADWRGRPNGGHAAGSGYGGAHGGGHGGGGPFAGLPAGGASEPYPRQFPRMQPYAGGANGGGGGVPPGGGAPAGPSQPNWGRRVGLPYAGYVAQGANRTMANYAASSANAMRSVEEQAAREFTTSGNGSFDAGTTSRMAKQLVGSQSYGQGVSDIVRGNEVVRTTMGYTFNDPRRQQFQAGGQGFAYMHPEMNYADIERARTGFAKAGTANILRGYGINTINPGGRATNPEDIGRQLSQRLGIKVSSKTTGAQIEATFNDQNSAFNEALSGFVASGAITEEQAQYIKDSERDESVALTKGWSREKYRTTVERAKNNDKGAQNALHKAGIKAKTAWTSEKNRASTEAERDANMLGGFSKGIQDANAALETFTKTLNSTVYGPFGNIIGYGTGAKGAFNKNPGEAGGLIRGALSMTGAGRLLGFGGEDAPVGAASFSGGGSSGGGSLPGSSYSGVGGEESGGSQKGAAQRTVKLKKPVNVGLSSGAGARFGMRYNKARGVRSLHRGVDFAAKSGTPIYAAESGTVLAAHHESGLGNVTTIDHGQGIVTLYAHQSSMRVKAGQSVRQGQVIGASGNTGKWTTGPHLHFEVHRNGTPVDPLPYIGGGGAAGSGGAAKVAESGAATSGSSDGGDKSGQPSASAVFRSSFTDSYGSINEVDAIAASLAGGASSFSGKSDGDGAATATKSGSGTASSGAASGTGKGTAPKGTGNASLREAIKAAGFTGDAARIAFAVGMAESGGKPGLVNDKNNTPAGSRDRGLFQINDHWHPGVSDEEAFDPIRNAKYAYKISNGGKSWQPWSAYKNGSYKKYLNSYRAGAWDVQSDEVAQLHEGEMVLKKKAAQALRDAMLDAPSKSSGSDVTLQFDAGSVVFQVTGAMNEAAAQQSAKQFVDALAKDARIKKIASGV